MAKDTPRNAPCPCGSGTKFKKCHGLTGPDAPAQSRRLLVPVLVTLLSVGVGVAVGLSQGYSLGTGAGGGVLILSWIFLALRNPPPPNSNSGDPAGLNFGR
jgi:hypothetical protein